MSEDRVVELRHPGSFSEDPLTAVLRSGAQRLLAQAVEMEVTAFIAAHGDLEDDAGRHRVVRHGHHRERRVQTGIGPVAVRCPRVRDRGGAGEAGKIRFTSAILPPYLRRAKSIEELLPWLYLKGISIGRKLSPRPLAALLGPDAPRPRPQTITRLKDVWQGELYALGKARPLGPMLRLCVEDADVDGYLCAAPDGARTMHPGHRRRPTQSGLRTAGTSPTSSSRERPVVARAAVAISSGAA